VRLNDVISRYVRIAHHVISLINPIVLLAFILLTSLNVLVSNFLFYLCSKFWLICTSKQSFCMVALTGGINILNDCRQ
jgi:hypothetical protein